MDPLFQAYKTHRQQCDSAQGLQQALQPLQTKLSSLTKNNPFTASLYKIPCYKVDKMKEDLTPTVIGLGAFHGKLDSDFQVTKLHFLNIFLGHCNEPIEIYWKKLEEMESNITTFYFPQPDIPKQELIERMIIDGGFLIELFLQYDQYKRERREKVFEYIPKHVMRNVKRDLLKYENQIPFEVVQLLWGIQHGQHPDSIKKLHKICMNFFEIEVPDAVHIAMVGTTPPKHLLEIYYTIHVFQHPPTARVPDTVVTIDPGLQVPNSKTFTSVPTASNLKEYGVKFNRSSRENEMWVRFSDKKLELPSFKIDDMNKCILANFVVYEQVYSGSKPVSALCYFLNSLMHNDKDVNVLAKKGIIENISGNDQDVADFFSHTCIDIEVETETNYLSCVVEGINDHFHSQLKRWWGTFLGEFFKSPWSIVIFIYGLVSVVINIISFVWQVRNHNKK